MKQLYINVNPLSFSIPGVLFDEDTQESEKVNIVAADGMRIANYALENNVDKICLYGNENYAAGLKAQINRELKSQFTSYSTNIPIEVEIKGVPDREILN